MINPFKRVEVNHLTLKHPRVDERTDGMLIAHITDVHHGRWVKSHHVKEVASWVNAQKPDLTVLTGDYVGYSALDIEPCVNALRHLDGPVYATLGNHDHWASTKASLEAFERAKIPTLNTASALVQTRRNHQLRVIGVDDAVTKKHDLDLAFSEARGGCFQLALSHVPELAPQVAQRGGHLILSGHTHGLQFNVPRVAEPLANKLGMSFIGGPYHLEESLLYVSRGLGSASWPWRFRASPELTFFRLEHALQPSLTLSHQHHISVSHPERAPLLRRTGAKEPRA
jgi:predicted MPP superfamily phosphohydrolase